MRKSYLLILSLYYFPGRHEVHTISERLSDDSGETIVAEDSFE